jgi:hypothetical protein
MRWKSYYLCRRLAPPAQLDESTLPYAPQAAAGTGDGAARRHRLRSRRARRARTHKDGRAGPVVGWPHACAPPRGRARLRHAGALPFRVRARLRPIVAIGCLPLVLAEPPRRPASSALHGVLQPSRQALVTSCRGRRTGATARRGAAGKESCWRAARAAARGWRRSARAAQAR